MQATAPFAVPSGLAAHLRLHYGIVGEILPVEGGLSNQIFLVQSESGQVLCRYYSSNIEPVRLDNEAKALLTLAGGISVRTPRFKKTIDGEIRTTFDGRALSCFNYLPGTNPYCLVKPPVSLPAIHSLGRTLAIIHRELNPIEEQTSTDKLVSPRDPSEVCSLLDSCIPACEKTVDPALLADTATAVRECLLALARSTVPRIRIHGDFHPGNVLFNGDTVISVFDFEYSAEDFRIFDLAMALGVFYTGCSFFESDRLAGEFLLSYERETSLPLSPVERTSIPCLLLFSFMVGMAWADSHGETSANPEIVKTFLEQSRSAFSNWHGSFLVR